MDFIESQALILSPKARVICKSISDLLQSIELSLGEGFIWVETISAAEEVGEDALIQTR